MKRVKLYAGNGYVGAVHEETVEFEDEEFDDLTESDLWEMADEFAAQFTESWFEIEDE